MCCFSRPVDTVADTNIFARDSKDGRQFLVYSMKFKSGEDLAMILPIPTPKNSAEDAVKFIDLKKYEAFFDDMRKGFPEPPPPRAKDDAPPKKAAAGGLVVVEVGDFVASFVPAIKDFARLDEQFRLPEGVWEKLPQYKEFGFAVFKLKKPKKGESKVHPMAFEFPRADKGKLFFPTVHIHDGKVHARADFDHALYCQGADTGMRWEESPRPAGLFMKSIEKSQGVVDGKAHVYRKQLVGTYTNQDTWV